MYRVWYFDFLGNVVDVYADESELEWLEQNYEVFKVEVE